MAIEAILAWSAKQALWQQDALRRIALAADLPDADMSSMWANLKQAHGIKQEDELICDPLTQDHLHPDAKNAPLTLLGAVSLMRTSLQSPRNCDVQAAS